MQLILPVLSDRVVSDRERERIPPSHGGSEQVCLFSRSSTRIVTSAADMQSSVRALLVRCLWSADCGARTPLEIEIRDVCRGLRACLLVPNFKTEEKS